MFAPTVRRALLASPLAAAMALASSLPAHAAAGQGWHVQTIVNTGTGSQGLLIDVSPDAPGDAWAAGLTISSGGTALSPLITRWNGTRWSKVTLPASARAPLGADGVASAVSASSPKNVWVFGAASAWAHYNGTTWRSGRLLKPTAASQVNIAAALTFSKSNVWAFGIRQRSTGTHAYAAHFNGAKWKATAVPGNAPIVDSSAVKVGDIWAVEGNSLVGPGGKRGALVHWSGGRWHSVRLPKALASRPLNSVVARSDKNIWVGTAVTNKKKGTTEAVGHWNGRAWTVKAMPAPASSRRYEVTGLTSDGHGGLWATANCTRCTTGNVPSRVWHRSAG